MCEVRARPASGPRRRGSETVRDARWAHYSDGFHNEEACAEFADALVSARHQELHTTEEEYDAWCAKSAPGQRAAFGDGEARPYATHAGRICLRSGRV